MKLLEIADPHLDPKWLKQQEPCLDLIRDTAKKEQVNFICIAGDLWNRPFYNSEKDSIKYVLDYIDSLLKICRVVMVTGTPSHDAPGSYHIFEKMGCHVLKPNKPKIINGVLFIGLSEIDKARLMSRKKLNLELANQYINDSINTYITNYWAPVREQHKDKPCIFLGHGAYVDDIVKAAKNPIIRNTDIIIDNNKLKEIKADRYIFGHFHTPENSKILNGGYVGFMGFDNAPWNCTGFQPGFNVTEISDEPNKVEFKPTSKNHDMIFHPAVFSTKTTRIDYPVIRKEKIKRTYNKNINLNVLSKLFNCDVRINMTISKKELRQINIKELEGKYKTEFNLNSCIIEPDIIREESERITKEQAEKIKTLWEKYCFFMKWEINSNQSVMLKINEIEKNVCLNSLSTKKKTVKLLSLEVTGSIFSLDAQNKKSFYYDFSNDSTGLTLISGDNGKGKSTFFGFASPYPIFIGFDYRTLKEFFPDNGIIEKSFLINGKKHRHVIHINKKIECYWNIEDEEKPFLHAIQLKDFMIECEKFFGPVDSFISTCFFSQEPHRMKKYVSSLTGATNTELRNAYMQIVGIDRSREKEYAKQKKDELLKIINDLEIEKSTMSNFIGDNQTIYEEKEKIEKEIKEINRERSILTADINKKKKEYLDITKKYDEQKRLDTELTVNKDNLDSKYESKNNIIDKLKEYENINIEELKKQVADNEKIRIELEKNRNEWKALNEKRYQIQVEINELGNNLKEYDNKLYYIVNKIKINKVNKTKYESENNILSKICFYCGKIPHPDNEEIIIANNKIIEDLINKNKPLENKKINYQNSKDLCKKNIEILNDKLPVKEMENIEDKGGKLKLQLLTSDKLTAIQNKIDEYKNIDILKNRLSEIEKEIIQFNKNIDDITKKQNPFIEKQYQAISKNLEELKTQKNNYDNEVSSKTGLLNSIIAQIEKIEKYKTELEIILKKLDSCVINMTEWESIELNMKPNKLPALELDLIACDIDFEVNQKLKEKYVIKTNTQYINKKGEIIDNFDILVYNPVSGIEKSLLAHSPGQRAAYFIEPISQALRKKRQDREGVEFMWSVADETDNPIKHTRVFDFYQSMIDSIPEGHTRFVMSQKSEVYNFIKNTIDIESIGI